MKSVFSMMAVTLMALMLSGCIFSSDSQNARSVAEDFWQAVFDKDMEQAKELVTWESADYLKYIATNHVDAQRFETGEVKITEDMAEVATILYAGQDGLMQVPARTVLLKVNDHWRVDVQRTMGSMVSGTMGAVVDEINDFMQQTIKGVDSALSDEISKWGKALDEGMQELQKELQQQNLNPSQPQIPPQDNSI
jgi:gas vesicle protein